MLCCKQRGARPNGRLRRWTSWSLPALALLVGLPVSPAGAEEPASAAAMPATRQSILLARRLEKRQNLVPYRVSGWEARLQRYEDRPVHLKLFEKGYLGLRPILGLFGSGGRRGAFPAGAGFSGGVGYTLGRENPFAELNASALYSVREYRQVDVGIDFPNLRTTSPLRGFVAGRYHDHTAVRFFGLGPDSARRGRSYYRSEGRTVSTGLDFRPHRLVELMGETALLNLDIGPSDVRAPSLEERFEPGEVPGFGASAEFWVHRLEAGLRLLDRGDPEAGVVLRGTLQRFDQRDGDRFDFTRLGAQVQLYLPLGHRNRMLAARLRTSHSFADEGAEVPFFLMETIGGADTLRSFEFYRFRDRRNLLLNLEYRWEVWPYLDFALFADFGKTFAERADLDFSDLAKGYGFGMRFHGPAGLGQGVPFVLRFDLARGDEGFRLHIGAGPRF